MRYKVQEVRWHTGPHILEVVTDEDKLRRQLINKKRTAYQVLTRQGAWVTVGFSENRGTQ